MTTENVPQPARKSSAKLIFWMVLTGMLLALSVVSIYMPRIIAWYAEPPSPIGVTCTPSIKWAFERMQLFQLYALPVGGLIGLLVGLKLKPGK